MAEFAKAFVTGCPIDHSLSPYIHHYWLQFYNLKGSYEAVLTSVEAFPRFLADMGQKGFIGGNITLPHKETAFSLVARRTAAAENVGAVNTVWLENGALCGTNSDWQGFIANLDDHAADWAGDTALVLGAGGTARAVIYALLQRGFTHIILANRTRERAEALAAFFSRGARAKIEVCALGDINAHIAQAGLLVNTGALGAMPAVVPVLQGACSDFPAQDDDMEEALRPFGFMDFGKAKTGALAVDSVYTPLQTPFLQAAARAGLKTVDGLGMLLHQAVAGFEQWFGERPQVTPELRHYIAGKLTGKI